jgi:NTE family protein
VTVTNDKLLLFKSHLCSKGLSDDALTEISDAAELVKYDSGDYVHRAEQALDSVFLVVHGRLKQSVVDMHGNSLLERFIMRGSQFGALGAAQSEPVPIDVIATEPSAVLKLDFETTLRFTREYDVFGLNLVQSISRMVSQVLLADRKPKQPSLVTVFHESPDSRKLTRRLIRRLLELGESPCVMSDQSNWEEIGNVGYRELMVDGQFLTREDVRRQFNLWSDSSRVIMDVDASVDPSVAAMLVEFSEQIIWCTSSKDCETSVGRLNAIESRAPGWRDKINLVWMLDQGEQVAPFAFKLDHLVERDFKIYDSPLEPGQGPALLDGFERLVHQLRGVRIGLALGGGGARGMAHLGVLKVLEENGIVVDMIAGTSVGAMTGILYSAGLDAGHLTDVFAEDLRPARIFRKMPRGNDWYLMFKYRRSKFNRMLRKYLGDWTLEQLPVPVESVTVDLLMGEPVVRRRGDAVDCVLESINLPVISAPICRNGQTLVDGGLVNNIPADVLVRRGCNFVIAVSVTAQLAAEFAGNRPDTPSAQMKTPSVLQTILRSYLVQSVNMNSVGIQPADVVIEPNVSDVELSDFSRTKELAATGKAAAQDAIPKIKSLLSQLDPQLFPIDQHDD